ncbi:MAG: YtxH domain-containing protein [Betaproteobacteria bacterium]|nr:YtxH domain-containing protein [Betaproteobacteria bacterium]
MRILNLLIGAAVGAAVVLLLAEKGEDIQESIADNAKKLQKQLNKLPSQTRTTVGAAQALVNQEAQCPGKRQRGARRQQQKEPSHSDAAYVGFDKGQQAREGLGRGKWGRGVHEVMGFKGNRV